MSVYSTKKILVVDDEHDVRAYLKSALEDYGFVVITASDGFEALEVLKSNIPDLISLDLVMPRHSGIKLFHDLRKNKQWLNIPVLIVTGHARDDLGKSDLDTLIMQGAGIYLEKPVKPDNYVLKVCQLLNIEPPEDLKNHQEENVDDLKDKLTKSLAGADTEALKRALDALKPKN
ncbi:MAG: response regulator with CheY-like receiver, AAA-type ATPase, and DNA-binding domain [Ignavibacteria bacterium]|nr:response regulator with CheY-like receiver, AAA-type ATPase, and DNA-binding domain [Ignavibacteria bacterium]